MATRNLKIKSLMVIPPEDHNLDWLRASLQAALELELSTLPPYLCGFYTLEDPAQTSDAATRISDIVYEEMSHLGLACNLTWAAGIKPEIFTGYDAIQYPGQLPGGVRPKCDASLRFPCDPTFEVSLGFTDYQAFVRMCMQIEYPEDPVLRPTTFLLATDSETYPTIGQFYDAVLNAFVALGSGVPYGDNLDKQLVKASPKVFKIDGLPNAKAAIQLIQRQGEGSAKYPYVDQGSTQLSHFYSFGEIYFGHKYVYDPVKNTGDWTGDKILVPLAYPMTPVPLGGYGPGAPPEVNQCDVLFTAMLQQLDDAWSDGGLPSLGKAIASMIALRVAALDLLTKHIPRPGGGVFGPQFKKVP
jgi:Ferritin-like